MKKKTPIYIVLISWITLLVSCEDLAFGDKFLQKPPSTDVTIDTIFSSAEYAKRVLWYSYSRLPLAICNANRTAGMDVGNIEGLTDLCQTVVGYGGVERHYYSGTYNAEVENNLVDANHNPKHRFYNSGFWQRIRHAWIFIENIDRVPDMTETEKRRLVAEAKTVIACYYAHMFRHYGGLPILDKSLDVDDAEWPVRATVDETVKFIVGLLDDAINCDEFPWVLPVSERANWDARMTKAAASGLKLRTLLFAASPLYNNTEAFYPGEASSSFLTWYGDYQQSRWEDARKAGEEFFTLLNREGYYGLVQAATPTLPAYRKAFQDAYFTRSTTEILISVRWNYHTVSNISRLEQSTRWGGFCPTKEYFDMFPMADGTDFDWNNPEHSKNPFVNRDPRLNETILLDGDSFVGETAEVFVAWSQDPENYPDGKHKSHGKLSNSSLATGIAGRKFALDRGGEFNGRLFQWPHLRLAEVYLSYAEALNECGKTSEAYQYINEVRARVGLKGLSGMSKEELREAILRERALEFGWEDLRFFDLIRWKKEDVFKQRLHGLYVHKNKNTGEYKFTTFDLTERAWWRSGGFSPKWYLSALPADEINKGYGMVQNPGWE